MTWPAGPTETPRDDTSRGVSAAHPERAFLRVLTFNTRFLPCLPGTRRRARVLASRLLAGDYDIVGLTEVFSEPARRILAESLRHEYPWSVLYVGSSRRFREDSGLMLWSRFPLEEVQPHGRYVSGRTRLGGSAPRQEALRVWFCEFGDCAGSDCLAGKGAAYVRVRVGRRLLHLFLAHLQASYARHGPARHRRTVVARYRQVEELRQLVAAALAGRTDSDAAIIFGDINVDGYRTAAAVPPPPNEWSDMLARLGDAVPGGLIDAWDRCAPPADLGYTYPAVQPAARRDYILAGSSAPTLAPQHVTLALDLWDPTRESDEVPGPSTVGHQRVSMSDHLGVVADFNTSAPGSRPRDAHPVMDDRIGVPLRGTISHPGGLQWYRFSMPAPTPVAIDVRGSCIGDPQVFVGRDISRPLLPITSEAGMYGSRKAYVIDGVSYLRVGDARSMATGRFDVQFSRV